jgi:acyl carrier protein
MAAAVSARALLAEALGCPVESVTPDAAIGTLPAWDSLAHIKVVLALEERIGRALSTDEILEIASLESIAALLGGTI